MHNSVIVPKTTGLYTLKWWFTWYADCISIKPLKNPKSLKPILCLSSDSQRAREALCRHKDGVGVAGRGAHSANGLTREEGGLWPGEQSSQAGSTQGKSSVLVLAEEWEAYKTEHFSGIIIEHLLHIRSWEQTPEPENPPSPRPGADQLGRTPGTTKSREHICTKETQETGQETLHPKEKLQLAGNRESGNSMCRGCEANGKIRG